MPTYVYRCKACNSTFEVEQRITEDPLTDCQLCRASAVERLITGSSFVLKGTGWYKTDYGSSSSSSGKSSVKANQGEGVSDSSSNSSADGGATTSGSEKATPSSSESSSGSKPKAEQASA